MPFRLKLFFILLLTLTVSYAQSLDLDSDGVDDFRDACIDTPRGYYVDEQGCESFLILHPDFSTQGAPITKGIEGDIKTLVAFLKNRPQIRIKIVGHSSKTAVSGDAYNLRLSQKRADMFKDVLVKRGISLKRIETEGKGFHEAMYPNDTLEGRMKNRRLEIEFIE